MKQHKSEQGNSTTGSFNPLSTKPGEDDIAGYQSIYPEVLTVKQAAQFLSLSVSTVYTYISKRRIPYVKKNGVVWLLRSKLMEWLLEGEKKTFNELSS